MLALVISGPQFSTLIPYGTRTNSTFAAAAWKTRERDDRTAARQQKERTGLSDERLIKACLKGDAEAWSSLIDKYKNLIYSIPIKLGMYQDASDIFQAVCVDLFANCRVCENTGHSPSG